MKTLLSVLLVVLFLPLVLVSLWLRSADALLRSPETLTGTVFSPVTLGSVSSVFGVELDHLYEKSIQPSVPLLSPESWPSVRSELLDAPWLAAQLGGVTNQAVEWLRGSSDRLALIVDLREKKASLGSTIESAMRESYLKLPLCSLDLSPDNACRNADETFDGFLLRIGNDAHPLYSFMRNIPDNVDLLKINSVGKENDPAVSAQQQKLQETLARFRSVTARMGGWKMLLFGAEVAILLLLILLHRHSLRSIAHWVGAACFFAGATAVFLMSSLAPIAATVVQQAFIGNPKVTAQQVTAILTFLKTLLAALTHPQFLPALLLLLFGLLCWSMPFFFRNRSKAGPILIRH